MKLNLPIDETSSIPKYIQIVKAVKSLIANGALKYGDKIPSINNLSSDYYLSRDTVEKAYLILKKQGIIASVKGKGYYINNNTVLSKFNILLLFNKLSAYKKEIYNALVIQLEDRADINFHVYHCELSLFKKLLEQQEGNFDYYVIMPHFKKDQEAAALELIRKLPQDKLILLDKNIMQLTGFFGGVFQDFKMDIYEALKELKTRMEKYSKILLVFPIHATYPYPEEILQGFKKFAVEFGFDFQIIPEIGQDAQLKSGEAYIVIEESDLVNLIKHARANKELKVGKNLGILSYNETPLKEVLQKGITVITTDFAKMGGTLAEMILTKKGQQVKNEFKVIVRESL
jgi:DNA-binding transcriptional regulator YhcF (GntR family)/CheY-like chemotaxis protein